MEISTKNNKKLSTYFHGRRILVTGGAGFIGSALIRKLLRETDSIIFNLDKMGYCSDISSITDVQKNLPGDSKKRHTLIKADLVDEASTINAVKIADPDLIFHFAAESHVDNSINNPLEFIKSNINGTYSILNASYNHYKKMAGDKKKLFRFHHISTDEVFGALGENGFFNESSRYDPRSPYSASKASSDHLVNAWYHTYNFPTITTNCSNNFGPYQYPEKLIPLSILRAINNKNIPIYGDGNNIRDWLYVEDHIEAILTVVEKGDIGEHYCIGGSNEMTNNELISKICIILDKKLNPKLSFSNLITFVRDRPGHDFRYAIDSSKIKSSLKWECSHDFEISLEKTINWYLKNQDWCLKIIKN